MIYTIGDSHSNFGWRNIIGVKVHWLGPKLMFTFKHTDFKITNIKDDDYVVFCFGEIDVRCHLEKHVVNGNYNELITDMCDKYIKEILKVKNQHNIKNILIYNILPTRRVDSVEPYEITNTGYQKYNESKAQPFPFIGSDLVRKENTIHFNSILKKMSEQNNLGFIDVYEKYTDKDGYLNMNLSDGTVHIGDKTFLEEYIKEKCFIKIY